MQSILVLKLAAIGDCLHAVPAVRALREAFPRARLAWLVGRTAYPAVVGQVALDEWIVIDDRLLVHPRWLHLLALALGLRRRRFDGVLVLHRAKSVRLLARASGARRRVGLVRDAEDRALLTDAVVDEPGVHEGERYWRAAERLAGQPLPRVPYRWSPSPEAALHAAERWRAWGWEGAHAVVAIAPGGGVNPRTRFDLKRWPVSNYVEIARRISADPESRVLVVGLPEDITAFHEWLGAAPEGVRTAVADLGIVGALLARADVCVANDSGLLHLAAAAGVPSVGIFGPTDPGVWGPHGDGHVVVRHVVPCQPCYKDDGVVPICDFDHRCMRDLLPDKVLGAIATLLRRGRG